eukprot:Pgem_evm2s7269
MKEEIILDENIIAEGKDQCVVMGVKPSPDHQFLAYSVDFTGNETYMVKVIDLTTGKENNDVVEGVVGTIQWGANNSYFFYLSEDKAKRPYKLWRHVIGTNQDQDVCLLTEEDELFYAGMSKSKDGKFLFCGSGSTETSEQFYLDLTVPNNTELKMIQEREFGLLYDVEHRDGLFFICTNFDKAINNRLMAAPVNSPSKASWVEVIPYDESRRIDDFDVFKDYMVLEGRQDGLTQLWTLKFQKDYIYNDDNENINSVVDSNSFKKIQFSESLYECAISVNYIYDTDEVRIYYSSLTTPSKWQNYNMTTGKFTLVKQKECLMYNPSLYQCKRIFAKANDGTNVPMSMVYRTDKYNDNSPNPTMLYAYGSYGICIDPCFMATILPYLDRGVVYVIAHIRGGGEMGRYWYEEQGKYLNKRNTFSDFINCAEQLIKEGITSNNLLACEGRSAGGLLIGSILNMRPDLFKIAVAGV